MHQGQIQLIAILGSTALLLIVLELVRRRRLLERYAVLWLLSAVVLVALSVWRNLLEVIASHIGIASPPNALFVVAFGFVLILLLHFSLAVSRLADQSKVLAQRLALMQERLARVEARADVEPGEGATPSVLEALEHRPRHEHAANRGATKPRPRERV
jgi:hypothetical protein